MSSALQRHRDASLVALQDLRAVEVTTIGNSFQLIRPHDRLCGFPDARQLRAIRSRRRHLVRNYQVAPGLYRDLHVVADDARTAAAGGSLPKSGDVRRKRANY